MDSFLFDAQAALDRSKKRSERPVRSVGDTVTIEDVDRFRFQNGKFGTFLKFNIKVLGGEWLYCQTNWDDNGQAIVTYLMEEAFGRHLVSKSKSADNFCKLLSTTPLNGTFEVTLKRRTLSENEGRQYTNWYVWINREDSPLEDARRQRWIDSDTERNGSNEERGDDNSPANTISPTPFEDATE